MAKIADWMMPEEWLTKEDVEIDLKYPDSGRQVSYNHLERKLGNVVVETRPTFFDNWDRITPLAEDDPQFNATRDEDAEFDAVEAFDYCYRAVVRRALIYMVHSVSSSEEEAYRPWSPRLDTDDPYQPPEELFADIVESVPLPDTPFKTIECDPYENIDDLYEDLVASNDILLEQGNERILTTRVKYMD